MAKLILVPNGQTVAEYRGIWEGSTDSELSNEGRYSAVEAGFRLAPIAIHAAYISEQLQAVQTAQRILSQQHVRVEPVPTRALNERNLGLYTGRHERDLQAALGKHEFQLARRGWDYKIPGGETLRQVYERRIVPFHTKVAERVLLEEIEEADPTVLVVTHQDPMRAYAKLLEGLPDFAVPRLEFASAEIRSYNISLAGKATAIELP